MAKWKASGPQAQRGQTNILGIIADGDIIPGAATMILAMGDGKKIAKAMDEFLKTTS